MGNQASAAAPAVIKQVQKAVPAPTYVDPATQCRVNQINLNQLERDTEEKRKQVESCNPAEAQQRKIKEEQQSLKDFRESNVRQFQSSLVDLDMKVQLYEKIGKAAAPLTKYTSNLSQEATAISEEMTKLEHEERMQRRNFLDGHPQDGVLGVPGLRTRDDKLLLAFWVTYGVCILAFYGLGLHYFGSALGTTMKKIQIGAVLLLVGYGLAYYGISVYG